MTFAGLAAFYLQLDAQFVGFAQILVYIGAVAILIVFAILLTRGSEPPRQSMLLRAPGWSGSAVAVAVFGRAERRDPVEPGADAAQARSRRRARSPCVRSATS